MYGASHPLEVEVAAALTELMPSMEMVRFGSSGTEAVLAAMRLARATTGRRFIVKFEVIPRLDGPGGAVVRACPPTTPGRSRDHDRAEFAGVAPAIAVHYLVLEIEALREAEDEVLRYRVLAREAELRAFKAQVDPHFLFNSLNAVASMCGSRPLEAREMAQRLADFFRLILRLGALERITLAEEIDLVQRYLAIEQVRFGERLTTHIDVDDGAARCMVPPLLLQPLVENAVRHGVASMVEGGTIDITATLEDHMLRIVIDNPADPDRADARGEGIGIENARGRLSAVSEGRAMLQAAEAEGQFRVVIELPR